MAGPFFCTQRRLLQRAAGPYLLPFTVPSTLDTNVLKRSGELRRSMSSGCQGYATHAADSPGVGSIQQLTLLISGVLGYGRSLRAGSGCCEARFATKPEIQRELGSFRKHKLTLSRRRETR